MGVGLGSAVSAPYSFVPLLPSLQLSPGQVGVRIPQISELS